MKEKGLDRAESFGKARYSCIASKEILHPGAKEAYDDERASLPNESGADLSPVLGRS